jgi:hypothetical protein
MKVDAPRRSRLRGAFVRSWFFMMMPSGGRLSSDAALFS